jgi:son of sevenless-like protein
MQDVTPKEIAIALTMVDAENYKRLRPPDYIRSLLRHSGPSNVEAAKAINAKVECWVKKTILRAEDLKSRVELLAFFIHIAEVCFPPVLSRRSNSHAKRDFRNPIGYEISSRLWLY